MNKNRPSIKDIAEKLDVSVTTISFVLNGKAEKMRISEKLTKRILEYAKKIDYKPNVLAQSLRTGKSKLIVVMVEDIYSKIARILEDRANQKGYKILFCSNDNKDEKALELIDVFLDRQADGFIIVPSPGIQNKIKALNDQKIPVVLFDRYFPDLESSYVVVDNENAIYKATKHLYNNDFKNIAYITVASGQTQMKNRLKGYSRAVEEMGIAYNVLELLQRQSHEDRKVIVKKYLLENKHINGICFGTNYLGKVGLQVIKENFTDFFDTGGLVTFDDDLLFKLYDPSITAIEQPLDEMGEKLIDVLMRQIEKGVDKSPINKVICKTKMNIRGSSFKKR